MSSTAKDTISFGGAFLDMICGLPRFDVGVDAAEVFAVGCPLYFLWYAWMAFPGLTGGKLSEPSLCIVFGIPLSLVVRTCLLSQASVVFTDLYNCVVWLGRWGFLFVFSLGSMPS